MNTKIIICCILIGLLVLSSVVIFFNNKEKKILSKTIYQGPVPLGYDEDYFRQTGITKPLENK